MVGGCPGVRGVAVRGLYQRRRCPPLSQAEPPLLPLRDDMWALMVGAGSKVSGGRSLVDAMSGMAEMMRDGGRGEGGSVVGWVGASVLYKLFQSSPPS